jgi:iron complex outermembrane recepter protein
VRFNGALFVLDWDDFQYSFTGENGLTNITNAGGARIKGLEADMDWAATDRLLISGGLSLLDAELTEDFCELVTPAGTQVPFSECFATDPRTGETTLPRQAADGTELPVVPKYKANLTGRYRFDVGAYDAFLQAALVYQGETRSALLPYDEAVLGKNGAYGLADLSAGFGDTRFTVELFVNNAFDKRASITRFAQCREEMCSKPYIVTNQPRTFGVKFGQKF